jgi:hypothetical protein
MLPITNHRVIHVPHSLATLAAIVALITAIGWKSSAPDPERTAATPAQTVGVERSADSAADSATESAANAARPASGSGEQRPSVSGLLPLVLPSISGR